MMCSPHAGGADRRFLRRQVMSAAEQAQASTWRWFLDEVRAGTSVARAMATLAAGGRRDSLDTIAMFLPQQPRRFSGGRIVYRDERNGQWVAVIERERAYEAKRSTRHQVTGMCLDYQPDWPCGLQMQGIASSQREMNGHGNTAFHRGYDDHIALNQGNNFARQQMRALRPTGCRSLKECLQPGVLPATVCPTASAHQRRLEFDALSARRQTTVRALRDAGDFRVENIFEARKLCHGLLPRS